MILMLQLTCLQLSFNSDKMEYKNYQTGIFTSFTSLSNRAQLKVTIQGEKQKGFMTFVPKLYFKRQMMCESTQAGGYNNHKPMAEMQRTNLFPYLASWWIPKETPGQQRHMRGSTGTIRLSLSWWILGLLFAPIYLPIHSLSPCSDLLCDFYDL